MNHCRCALDRDRGQAHVTTVGTEQIVAPARRAPHTRLELRVQLVVHRAECAQMTAQPFRLALRGFHGRHAVSAPAWAGTCSSDRATPFRYSAAYRGDVSVTVSSFTART